MAIPSKPRRVPTIRAGSNGNLMRNLILLGLPADESDAVLKKLVFVELPLNSFCSRPRSQSNLFIS